jgi:mRNA-degrading endonuclease RelE of RelBE toxin-antitoxin system
VESSWTVEFTDSAARELQALSEPVKRMALETAFDLAEDPFPPDSLELRGYAGLFRVPFYGHRYRMVYQVSLKQRRVVIARIRPRGTAYIGMKDGD